MIHKGQLVRWNDAKGFGFIRIEQAHDINQPANANHEVFIHVSALGLIPRRPLVGDTLFFQILTQKDGKQRAVEARIEGMGGSSTQKTLKHSQPSQHRKSVNGVLYRIAIMLVVLAIASFTYNRVFASTTNLHGATTGLAGPVSAEQDNSTGVLQRAFEQGLSNLQVQSRGVVSKVLADDNKGSRHQRFILTLPHGQTVLVAHNIDLAPRISDLNVGDSVEFYGEYEWNKRGGVVHWTHHDPQGRHIGGWLKHNGQTYQ
ncbi:putative cold-shock DNA-binding domain protein [Shewanella halifaxensis HAW-EB4]|uniref:Cold-shock DNA-binding domain protein n=1 Tax=Shewanella halifaxensis (strain HAW-EB4) TaxID=458817 RepID=B0TTB5_SHEHH|nr:DUF3465 domain-containing protein [Shewanella halifaxensis]ABZ78056.1 putative cold-shock DNA-binding domain protein [Shewanella halifaxensis HAW-EB4]